MYTDMLLNKSDGTSRTLPGSEMRSLGKRTQPPKALQIATPGRWQDSQGLNVFIAHVERIMFIESLFKTF